MLPLLQLPTDGKWMLEKLNPTPPPTEKPGEDEKVEQLSPERESENFRKRFGDHIPLTSVFPNIVCRAHEQDKDMLALTLWTGEWTFMLIAAYNAFSQGLKYDGCKDMSEFCGRFIEREIVQKRAVLTEIAMLPLFFAPLKTTKKRKTDDGATRVATQNSEPLRELLKSRAKEFDELGCAFPARVGERCSVKTSLLCPRATLVDENKVVDAAPGDDDDAMGIDTRPRLLRIDDYGVMVRIDDDGVMIIQKIPRLEFAIEELEYARGLRLLAEIRGYKIGMHVSDLFKELVVRNLIQWEGDADDIGKAKSWRDWHRNPVENPDRKYANWLSDVFATDPNRDPGNPKRLTEAELISRFAESVAEFKSNMVFHGLPTILPKQRKAVEVIQGDGAKWSKNVYVEKAVDFLLQEKTADKRRDMLLAATEVVTQHINKLWVEVPQTAGPVFRGDLYPQEWLDSKRYARWPLATSFNPYTALFFWKRHLNAAVDEGKANKDDTADGKLFAILVAKGVKCIDIVSRLGKDGALGGAHWLTCFDESELLLDSMTEYVGVRKTDGSFFTVADVRNDSSSETPPWKLAVKELFTKRDMAVEAESLVEFEESLKQGSGIRQSRFKTFSLAVAFPHIESQLKRRKLALPEMPTTSWTDFSDLVQFF